MYPLRTKRKDIFLYGKIEEEIRLLPSPQLFDRMDSSGSMF